MLRIVYILGIPLLLGAAFLIEVNWISLIIFLLIGLFVWLLIKSAEE